jgi:hypothetical protein
MRPSPIPPADVAAAAKSGLELREKFHRGGTSVGVQRAQQLAERRPVSRRDTIAAGYVAWLLWGGEPGRRWADSLKARLKKTAAE